MPKPSTKPSRSFDTIATRNLWGAVTHNDAPGLRKILAARGNPNDQQRRNAWTPPVTPLLKAVEFNFVEGVELLLKAGARRRASGSDGVSAFATAIHFNSAKCFAALWDNLGGMTQTEIIECFDALNDRLSAYKDKELISDSWGGLLIEHLCRHQVKFTQKTAVAVCMNLLGGDAEFPTLHATPARQLLEQGLLAKNVLVAADRFEEFEDWALQLARRKWDDESKPALEMLHDLGFPFGAAAAGMKEGPEKDWLLVQQSDREHRQLSTRAPQVASRTSKRLRL